MTRIPHGKIFNFIWFQALWLIAVLDGITFEWVLLGFIVAHLALVKDWHRELLLIAEVACLGVTIDSLIAMSGAFVFPGDHWLPIPAWHAAIWAGFAATLRHSMAFMVKRPRLMLLMSGLCAPLAYLAAARLGAVEFPMGYWSTALLVSASWLTLTPVMIWMTNTANQGQTAAIQRVNS